MPPFSKKYKIERLYPSSSSSVWSRKYRKAYSSGYGKRRFYKSVARTRGALFASPETKYFDFGLVGLTNIPSTGLTSLGTSVTTTPYFPPAAGPTAIGTCFAPVLGNDISNRIGRKVCVKKIRVNGTIYVATQTAQADTDTPVIVRGVLFIDKQSNSTQPTLNDVFQTNGNLNNAYSSINVPQNLATLGRFRILKDKKFKIGDYPITGTAAGPAIVQGGKAVPFKFHVKFKKPLIIHFNATNGGTYADIVENSINLNFVSNNTAAVPQVQYYGRVTYTDV